MLTLPSFQQVRMVIVGDIMLDRYYSGDTQRISPEAPVPVVKVNDHEARPGGAANVAINAAALGAQVTLIGLCGAHNGQADEASKQLTERLAVHDIDCHFAFVDGMDTITKLRVMSRNQQLLRLDFEQSFAQVNKEALVQQYATVLGNADVVVLSDYAKGTLSDPQTLITMAKQANVPVIIDPKGNDYSRYRGATLLTPNMAEFSVIKGHCDSEGALSEAAQALRNELDLSALLVTRSEDGMSLFADAPDYHLPANAKEVYDVTGAGDTVVATLAAGVGAQLPLPQACVLANQAASIVVGKLGTSTVTPTELAVALQGLIHEDSGVLNQEQVVHTVQQWQQQGKKVVMTNGCFDILHAGHVSYLQAAAKLGDRLVVAVNDDASVERLKGPGRPVNNVSRRMAVLAGLGAVDLVVPFADDTPQALIAAVLPDILVKGGDYKVEEIAGGAQVIANGGSVQVLHFEDGVSTTAIIQQIVHSQ